MATLLPLLTQNLLLQTIQSQPNAGPTAYNLLRLKSARELQEQQQAFTNFLNQRVPGNNLSSLFYKELSSRLPLLEPQSQASRSLQFQLFQFGRLANVSDADINRTINMSERLSIKNVVTKLYQFAANSFPNPQVVSTIPSKIFQLNLLDSYLAQNDQARIDTLF